MPQFKFLRTMQYTEVVTVDADDFQAARELAQQEDGERNHDDTVIDMVEVKPK